MIQKNERRKYASDLSDSQWAIIEPLFPRARNRSKWEKRELVDAVLYFVDNGCKCRNLPHDFPPYTTVANFYYAAIRSGLWEKIRAALVERVRTQVGRNAGPSYAIIDSQSVKTTSAAEDRGIDGGKNKRTQTAHQRERPSRNIHSFSGSVPMQDTAKLLSKIFLVNWASVLIFQHALSRSGKSCPSDGLLSVPWLGSTIPAAFPKITRYLSVLLRPFVLSLLSIPC